MKRFEVVYDDVVYPGIEVTIYKGTPKERSIRVVAAEFNELVEDAIENDRYMDEIKEIDLATPYDFYLGAREMLEEPEEKLVRLIEDGLDFYDND